VDIKRTDKITDKYVVRFLNILLPTGSGCYVYAESKKLNIKEVLLQKEMRRKLNQVGQKVLNTSRNIYLSRRIVNK